MIRIIKDPSLAEDGRLVGILEVRYPDPSEWDIAGFEKYKEEKLDNVLPEKILKSEIDRKEEHNDIIEGEFRVTRHIKYERTIAT